MCMLLMEDTTLYLSLYAAYLLRKLVVLTDTYFGSAKKGPQAHGVRCRRRERGQT